MSDKQKEMASRVEEARKKIMAEREEFKKKAPKITQQLLKGIEYKEDVVVKLKDDSYGVLTISALGEGEVLDIMNKFGIGRLSKMGEDDINIENFEFFWNLIEASSGLPKKAIKTNFAIGESPIVGMRILEISGFGRNVEKETESFLAQ